MPIAPSDTAVAARSPRPTSRIRSGTATSPPPTPKSALKSPATSPMPTSRTRLSYGGMATASLPVLARLAAEPELAAILLDVDGVLAPIVDVPADADVPDTTRAELRRLHGRYALVACVSGRAGTDAARVVGVPELVYVGEHGLELAPDAAAGRERLHDFA